MGGAAWDRSRLDRLADRLPLLRPGDAGYTAYTADVVLTGSPDAVVRPRDEADIVEVLRFAHGNGIPVTVAGGQTSVTGSSVADGGILLATERMDRILDIGTHPQTGNAVAVAEPGIFLGDFQRALEDAGWFYPPDPTSRNEARLGATVATNATGEDTLLYGPTRIWIRELRVVRADGTVRTLTRGPDDHPSAEKGGAGYCLDTANDLDRVIGSEGTLAVVTRVTVDLIPRPPACLAGVAFFPRLAAALAFVVAARKEHGLRPRALELLDGASLDLVRGNPEGIRWPESAGAAVVFKQEYADDSERDRVVSGWLALLERVLGDRDRAWADHVLVIEDSAGLERLRGFRHRVPASVNERVQELRAAGGGKVATDWWVPYPEIPEFLTGWMQRIEAAGLRAVVFGHIGNGHPHVNFLPASAEETGRARALVREMCREAVARGGGVAGEHGLGKIKRDLLAIQHPRERIRAMIDIKRAWDPRWILGRGNLFDPSEAAARPGEGTP